MGAALVGVISEIEVWVWRYLLWLGVVGDNGGGVGGDGVCVCVSVMPVGSVSLRSPPVSALFAKRWVGAAALTRTLLAGNLH